MLGRRAVLGGAALAVPAIMATVATPAHAASGEQTLTVSVPNNTVVATGPTVVTATVIAAGGAPKPGAVVTFQAPAGASLSQTTVTTDGNGQATTSLDLQTPWRKPGSTVTVTAICESKTASVSPTVLGSNLLQAAGVLTQTELVFPSPVVQASASDSTGNQILWRLALLQNGQVWGQGFNQHGQLGDGTTISRSAWAPIPGLTNVTQIAMGMIAAFALRSDGTLWSWGNNQSGMLGTGDNVSRATPGLVSTLSGTVVQVAAREQTAYAVMSDGTVRAWGANSLGSLGNGLSSGASSSAVTVVTDASSPLSSVTSVAAGTSFCLARRSDGSVFAWGYNAFGQLGDGTTTNRTVATPVPGLGDVTMVAAGPLNGFALLSSGAVKSWGENSNGTLGNSSMANSSVPVQVTGLTSGVAQIAAIGSRGAERTSAWALMTDGTLRSWGYNDSGQLGYGSTTTYRTPGTPSRPSGSPAVSRIDAVQCRRGIVVLTTP
ncbi:hypothetical protein ASF76_08810 [Microbacterium sp. Leaf151]|nr:hypothetical protein ASF76_08810 [Microbacterium sp. Leaf151]